MFLVGKHFEIFDTKTPKKCEAVRRKEVSDGNENKDRDEGRVNPGQGHHAFTTK